MRRRSDGSAANRDKYGGIDHGGTMTDIATASQSSRAYKVLGLTAIATFLVSLDVSIVVVARRTIEEDLGHPNILTWVFSAYSIAYAAGLLTAGRFADVYGRKRAFLRGLFLFSVGSALCGLAPSAIFLVLARIVQAIGGAQLTPASLALVLPEFPVEKRTQAIAIWGAFGGLAAAAGPSAGGLLVDTLGWRSLFFINIPFCAFTIIVGRRMLHESRDESATRRVDYPSVVTGFTGVALVVLGISQSEVWGWTDPFTLGAIAIGLVLVAAFIRRCDTVEHPLLDLSLFRLPFVVAANVAGILFSVGFIGMWLLNTTWLQTVWSYSVVKSGVATMPGPLIAATVAPFAGRLAMRYGHARVLFAGSILLSAGTFCLAHSVSVTPDYWRAYLPWMLVTGVGVGLSISTLSSSATAFLKPTQFAMGSALNTTARQVGTALGAALSLAIAAPTLSAVGALLAGGGGADGPEAWRRLVDGVELAPLLNAWYMNGAIYMLAGILMILIFRTPTDEQMAASYTDTSH